MGRLSRHLLARYSVAILTVALALLVTLSLPPLRDQSSSALFFAAVMVSSWYGGLGPGLLATALSAWAVDYFVVPPAFSLVIGWDDVLRIGVFILVAVLISSLNAARGRLEAMLRQRADELARADRRKDEFLAMLVHELRNPLAPMLNALHLLRRCDGDKLAAAQAQDLLERQVRQLSRLVEDMLDLSRISKGKIELRKKLVDVATAVAHAVETARPCIDERDHRLGVALPDGQVRLEADPARLEQIIVNLLGNAAKYTEPGGQIQLTVEREKGAVLVRVRDTGIGLPAEILPRIFDLFVQAENGSQGGLGIGLNLVRGLVELHGGSVSASSAGPGQGSEFVVRLPAPTTILPENSQSQCERRAAILSRDLRSSLLHKSPPEKRPPL